MPTPVTWIPLQLCFMPCPGASASLSKGQLRLVPAPQFQQPSPPLPPNAVDMYSDILKHSAASCVY